MCFDFFAKGQNSNSIQRQPTAAKGNYNCPDCDTSNSDLVQSKYEFSNEFDLPFHTFLIANFPVLYQK